MYEAKNQFDAHKLIRNRCPLDKNILRLVQFRQTLLLLPFSIYYDANVYHYYSTIWIHILQRQTIDDSGCRDYRLLSYSVPH